MGAVAVIGTPNRVNGQHLHDEVCEPLWNELEDLNVPIGFHPTGTTSLRDDAGRRYRKFTSVRLKREQIQLIALDAVVRFVFDSGNRLTEQHFLEERHGQDL